MFAPAYRQLEALAAARNGHPLHLREIVHVLGQDAATAAILRRLSDELDAGLLHDPDTLAGRLNMPAGFVAALLLAIKRGDGLIAIETVYGFADDPAADRFIDDDDDFIIEDETKH